MDYLSIAKQKGYSDMFFRKVQNIADMVNLTSNDVLWALYKESRLDYHAENPKSKAYGLFQLMPRYFAHYGFTKNFTPEQQLDVYVTHTIMTQRSYIHDKYDLYIANFLPELFHNDVTDKKAVAQNKPLSQNGRLTKASVKRWLGAPQIEIKTSTANLLILPIALILLLFTLK